MSRQITGLALAATAATGLCLCAVCAGIGAPSSGGDPGSVPGIGLATESSGKFTGCGRLDSPWGEGSVEIHRGDDFDCLEAVAMTRQYFTDLTERQYGANTALVHLDEFDVYCSTYGVDETNRADSFGYKVSCTDITNEVLFVP